MASQSSSSDSWTGSPDPEPQHALAVSFGQLATQLQAADGIELTVDAVVRYARQAVSCSAASVVLVGKRGRPEVVALTEPDLAELYRDQFERGSCPVLSVAETGQLVVVDDVAAESRWPREWRDAVLGVGIRSAIHLPLLLGGRLEAVMSLYSGRRDGFDRTDVAVAHILADQASAAIAAARVEAQLEEAIDVRGLIGQAMGILMERFQLDADRAFLVLQRYSQHSNRKLYAVAEDLIRTRKLPE